MGDMHQNTLDSVRLLIDATRKELSYIQTLVLYGDNNGKSINTKMVEFEKDIEAMAKAIENLDERIEDATLYDSEYKEATDKRIKAIERVVWMIVGAGVIGGSTIALVSNAVKIAS